MKKKIENNGYDCILYNAKVQILKWKTAREMGEAGANDQKELQNNQMIKKKM